MALTAGAGLVFLQPLEVVHDVREDLLHDTSRTVVKTVQHADILGSVIDHEQLYAVIRGGSNTVRPCYQVGIEGLHLLIEVSVQAGCIRGLL